jgi:hypothetical protein
VVESTLGGARGMPSACGLPGLTMLRSGFLLDPRDLEGSRMRSAADMERVLENLDRRLMGVEQTLPTLATKTDLERFATKADLDSGVAQVRAFTEQVRDEVRVVAAGYGSLSGRVDSLSTDVKGVTYTLDTLVMRLEAKGLI